MEEHNITIKAKGKCPQCKKGNLLPFLEAHYIDEAMYNPRPEQFGHYTVYYRCDHCNFRIEGDTFIGSASDF